MKHIITTTGQAIHFLPPDGPERDELLGLVRLGLRFRGQQQGRRPGFLHGYLLDVAGKINGPLTFDALLLELGIEARKRELLGESASPVERVDTTWEMVIYHHPRMGRVHLPFGTLRNHLTRVKKLLDR